MADGTVDNLNIQISASANRAEKALNSLATTLTRLNKSFNSLNIGGVRNFTKEIGALSSAIGSIGKVNVNEAGLKKVTNALSRLMRLDTSGIDADAFSKVSQAISSLSNLPDISSNTNRIVSSFARLANAGNKTGQSASGIVKLGQETRKAAQEMQGLGSINDDVNMFVQSIARLASAGNKTGDTASNLGSLADAVKDFMESMKDAPQISQNTIQMVQAMGQLASSGGRVNVSTNTVSSAMSKLSSVMDSAKNRVRSAAQSIVESIRNIGSSSKSVNSLSVTFGSFLKGALFYKATSALSQFGYNMFELGSAITEVENVVDVSFGSMADKAYEFAETATEQFGLSELAALKYSGTMMAMLNSTGVAQDAAAEMSVTLAGLAGDLASFYNIETEEAFTKLRAAIAGETEPMRQLGINMTVAALQSYALSQGITKSWQSMTQAEQAMLRYNYIMSATSAQQNDFARTSGSWANQVRLLTLNFQTLAATIGQGLIAAILPVIQALNALMAKLIQVAESFRNFVYALMGKKLSGSQQGIVDDSLSSSVADIGSAGETAAGGLDDATGAAQDLKKALSVLPFDQLNQLTDNTSSSGGGSGSGGSGGGVGGGIDFSDLANAFDELEKTEETPFNEWAERMRKAFLAEDWEKLGEEIAWGLNKGLKKIYDVLDWNKVGPPIIKFVDAFTTTLNSLIDSIDWDLLGRDFGRGLNIITRTANRFLEGVDFVNLGRKLSKGLRGALDEINWKSLGNMLGNGFMVAWDIFNGFVEDMSRFNPNTGKTGWQEFGDSVAEGINGAFEKINFSEMANTLSNGINGVFQSLLSFTTTFNWEDFANNVINGINTFIEQTNWEENGEALEAFLDDFFSTLLKMASEINWEEFAEGVGQFLSEIDWGQHLMQLFNVLTEVIGGIWTGLGQTAAGKFIQAIIVFKIGTKLMPFINNIVKFFTGSTATEKLSSAFQNLFNKSISTGADKVRKGLSTNAKIIGLIAAITATINATMVETSTDADLPDTIDSYEKISQAFKNLGDSAIISQNQAETLQYQLDKGVADNEDAIKIYTDLGQSLYDMGVSSEEVSKIFSELGDDVEKSSYYITGYMNTLKDTNSIDNSQESIRRLKDALQELKNQGLIETDKELNAFYSAIDMYQQKGWSAAAITSQIRQSLINLGVDANYVDEIMKMFLNAPAQSISQSASTIQATLGSLGFAMGDEFINNLAEKTPEVQEAILNTFQSISDGTQVKASEIADIFSTMGITLPESISGAFASMEPSVLASTIAIFDQISNGQSLKYDELVSAFQTLGIDITNTGLIQTLAGQEVNVQQSAILLLSQLSAGVALSENQLVYAFQSLGIGIANDGIIASLADAEPDVQKQAIDLLGQIQSAAESERQPLIDQFNELGVGTVNNGLLNALDNMDYDTRNKTLELLSEISGATTERRGEILAELENLGLDVGAGLIDSMDAKKRDISDEALELVNAFMDSLDGSEGFDSHSPSKKTETSGENAGQGLINGAISKKKLIKTAAETLSDTFLQPFDNLVNSMYSLGQNAISQYIAGFQSMYIPTPHMYVSSYRKYITGNSSFSIPNFSIDWYAVGGLFREATIAGIGEKGAEAVLPLTDRRAMGMIADSILNNASVGMDEEVLTNAVARGVAMAMMNNQGNNTPINVYATLYTEDNEVLARAVTKGQQSLDRRMNPTSKLATI